MGKELGPARKTSGALIRSAYLIFVNAEVQSCIHIVASCLMGAFCYRGERLNIGFLVPFGLVYLLLICVIAICNKHRTHRLSIVKVYESSYQQIAYGFQEEIRKNVNLFDDLQGKELLEMFEAYQKHDVFTETCFRLCSTVGSLLENIGGEAVFRVATFRRENKEEDGTHTNCPLL